MNNALKQHWRAFSRFALLAYVTIAVGVVSAVPASAATVPMEVRKICPPANEGRGIERFLGLLWGYADKYGTYLAIGAVIALIVVAAFPGARRIALLAAGVTAGLLLFAGVIIGILQSAGTC